MDGVAQVLDSHIIVDFFTNESCLRRSRVPKFERAPRHGR